MRAAAKDDAFSARLADEQPMVCVAHRDLRPEQRKLGNAGGDDAIPAQPEMKIDSGIGLAYDVSGSAHNGRVYMVYR